jgi:membrane protease YdiL (CAAX protease family)
MHPVTYTVLMYAIIWAVLFVLPPSRALLVQILRPLPEALRSRVWIGLASGAILVMVDVLALMVSGQFEFRGMGSHAFAAIVLNLAVVFFIAASEELMLRGILFYRLRQVRGVVFATIATAVLFMLLHSTRRDFSAASAAQWLLDGVFLALLVHWTGDIWTSVGWHFGKNLAVAELLGGSYHLKEPLLRFDRHAGMVGDAAGFGVDLAAFAVSVLLCVALLALTRAKRFRQDLEQLCF